ncbi:MAG: cobalt ABC transporter ATP-binding protein, partial [Candidatus Aureabacteria bacterium]|nr:cobalt ABC transporter ATP-binding protein [Candidatus Auribacterota bacterium]
DEPSASLDPVGKKSLIQSLKSIDAAMIIATHDLESVSELCTHFIVLHHGSIVKEFDDPRSVSHYWSDLC